MQSNYIRGKLAKQDKDFENLKRKNNSDKEYLNFQIDYRQDIACAFTSQPP